MKNPFPKVLILVAVLADFIAYSPWYSPVAHAAPSAASPATSVETEDLDEEAPPSPTPVESEKQPPHLENAMDHELPPLILGQGEQRLLRIPGLKRFSIGSPIARSLPIRDLGQSALMIKAVSPGETDLILFKGDGATEHRLVRVEKISSQEVSGPLLKSLSRLDQTEIFYSGSGVIMKGVVQSFSEASKIAAISQAFPKDVFDETEFSPALLELAHQKVSDWLKKSKYSTTLRVEDFSNTVWVRGNLENPNERSVLEKKLRAQFPGVQLDFESLPDNAPTVHFKVFLLELKREKFRSLGLGWPSSQDGAFHVTTSGVTDLLGLDLKLQALEGDGSVKVLSNPELVVRAPGEAELFSGGEIPIKSESRFYSQTSWKTFGLTLRLKITHSTQEKARLDIFTEVSRLDPSLSLDDKTPGLQANRMTTQVDARYGFPLFLSGLLQDTVRKQARGLPLLRNIPVLGALFGSEDYLSEKSELVAVLVPSLDPPPPPVEKFQKHFPKGEIPIARNWVSPDQERALKQSSNYPWNALE